MRPSVNAFTVFVLAAGRQFHTRTECREFTQRLYERGWLPLLPPAAIDDLHEHDAPPADDVPLLYTKRGRTITVNHEAGFAVYHRARMQ